MENAVDAYDNEIATVVVVVGATVVVVVGATVVVVGAAVVDVVLEEPPELAVTSVIVATPPSNSTEPVAVTQTRPRSPTLLRRTEHCEPVSCTKTAPQEPSNHMNPNPSPGWYPDPANPSLQRLWDGETWTEQTRSPAPPQTPLPVPVQGPPPAGGTYGPPRRNPTESKKTTAGILAIILGGLGIHKFYLGYTGAGILQLLISIVTCGAGSVIGLAEGIIYLTKTDEEFVATYQHNKKPWF